MVCGLSYVVCTIEERKEKSCMLPREHVNVRLRSFLFFLFFLFVYFLSDLEFVRRARMFILWRTPFDRL